VKAADNGDVRGDDPGSSAADVTGMGNSFEYPNSDQYKTKASPKPEQRAGTVAPTDSNPKINNDTSKKDSGSCTVSGSSVQCSPECSLKSPKASGDQEVLD
jgi:hypothetical protein